MRTQSPQRTHLLGSRTSDGDDSSMGNRRVHGLETHLANAKPLRQALQLAVCASRAGRTLLVVVGQQQFNGNAANLANLRQSSSESSDPAPEAWSMRP